MLHAVKDQRCFDGDLFLTEAEFDADPQSTGVNPRPEFRDITDFYGIDFHQDLTDYKHREADFATLYVDLHAVGRTDAPLFLLDGSHRLGGVVFPHDLERTGAATWLYSDGIGGSVEVRQHLLVGAAGYAARGTPAPCTALSPTPPTMSGSRCASSMPGRPPPKTGIDRGNATEQGPVSLTATRQDLAADGSARINRTLVNQG